MGILSYDEHAYLQSLVCTLLLAWDILPFLHSLGWVGGGGGCSSGGSHTTVGWRIARGREGFVQLSLFWTSPGVLTQSVWDGPQERAC